MFYIEHKRAIMSKQKKKLGDEEFRHMMKMKQNELNMMVRRGYSSKNMFSFVEDAAVKFNEDDDPFYDNVVSAEKMRELRENGYFQYREDFSADYYIGDVEKPERKAKILYIDTKETLDNQLPGKNAKKKDTGVNYINSAMDAIASSEEVEHRKKMPGAVYKDTQEDRDMRAGAIYDEIILVVKSKLTTAAKLRMESWKIRKLIILDEDMLFPIFNHAFSSRYIQVWKSPQKFYKDEGIERKNLSVVSAQQPIYKQLGVEPGDIVMHVGASPIGGEETYYKRIIK